MKRVEVRRTGPRVGQDDVHVVVQEGQQPHLARELQDAVERRIAEARRVAHRLRGHHLLVNRELSDPREHPRVEPEHAADVVGRVHVGGVEARDHGIEPVPLRPAAARSTASATIASTNG